MTYEKFHKDIVFTIMSEHSDCFELVSLLISLLRKLMSKSKAAKDKLAEMYLLTFAAIVETHTDKEKQIKCEGIVIPPNLDPVKAFLLKETIATMGELAAEPEHREALIAGADVVFDVLQAARQNFAHPKLMKTALGCLINFSAENPGGAGHNGADLLSREPCFYQVIYSILDDSDSKPLMLEYVLRLINVTAS